VPTPPSPATPDIITRTHTANHIACSLTTPAHRTHSLYLGTSTCPTYRRWSTYRRWQVVVLRREKKDAPDATATATADAAGSRAPPACLCSAVNSNLRSPVDYVHLNTGSEIKQSENKQATTPLPAAATCEKPQHQRTTVARTLWRSSTARGSSRTSTSPPSSYSTWGRCATAWRWSVSAACGATRAISRECGCHETWL
jgi:hypothetical protein